MIGFTGIKAAAAPYMLAIKIAIVVVAFTLGAGVGCSARKAWDADKIAAVEKDRDEKLTAANHQHGEDLAQIGALASQLNQITADTERQVEEAKARAKAARDAAAEADKRSREARRAASAAQVALDKAKRDPGCRALLETKACATFR